jgi:hypothetical protein
MNYLLFISPSCIVLAYKLCRDAFFDGYNVLFPIAMTKHFHILFAHRVSYNFEVKSSVSNTGFTDTVKEPGYTFRDLGFLTTFVV